MSESSQVQQVDIPMDDAIHAGLLGVPEGAGGIVLFAHGSGSSRLSARNNYVAGVLRDSGIATLLFDLLTEQEDRAYETRFDIPLLTHRLRLATEWIRQQPQLQHFPVGYFGASTGAAAALEAAAQLDGEIGAVVSRGGRPDMAGKVLGQVTVPTLLIVGGNDDVVIQLNEQAFALLNGDKDLIIIPGATHLFDEPGTLEEAARLAAEWFVKYLVEV